MALRLQSPYSNNHAAWFKGNLHTHTTNSDGNLSPQDTIATYAGMGYHFLMLSDHDKFTDPALLDPCGLTLIPGCEITANGPHMLHVNANGAMEPVENRQNIIDAVNGIDNGGFCIMNHPNWLENFNHCDHKNLEAWQGYAGIEIYNGVCRRAEGSPLATDRWDRLLSAGRKVWGYANDDNHRDWDRGVAWNVVQAEDASPGSIVKSLREGRFYASTGVVIDSIEVEGNTLRVRTQNAQRHYVSSLHGRVPAIADGRNLVYTLPDEFPFPYIRIECWGPADAMAWTQPFLIEKD